MKPSSNYHFSVRNGITIIKVFTLKDESTNEALFEEVFEPKNHFSPNIVIDLGQIKFINSLGLNLLLKIHNQSEVLGGRVVLVETSSKVHNLIKLTRLNEVFTIATDVDHALNIFQSN